MEMAKNSHQQDENGKEMQPERRKDIMNHIINTWMVSKITGHPT